QHLQQQQDLVAGGAVEVAGRLVANQERRVGDNSSRDGHALLLTARQLLRLVPAAVREPDQREGDGGAPPPLRRGQVREEERQFDVPLGGQHGEQVVELEHEADIGGAPGRQFTAPELVDAPPVDLDG